MCAVIARVIKQFIGLDTQLLRVRIEPCFFSSCARVTYILWSLILSVFRQIRLINSNYYVWEWSHPKIRAVADSGSASEVESTWLHLTPLGFTLRVNWSLIGLVWKTPNYLLQKSLGKKSNFILKISKIGLNKNNMEKNMEATCRHPAVNLPSQ